MEEIALIEHLESVWKKITPGEVYTSPTTRGGTSFWFADKFGDFIIFLGIILGRKNGVVEEVTVLDTSKKIVLDRLVVSEVTNTDGTVVSLPNLRGAIRDDRERAKAICLQHMWDVVRGLREDPEEAEDLLRTIEPRHSVSVRTVSAGAFELGKRH